MYRVILMKRKERVDEQKLPRLLTEQIRERIKRCMNCNRVGVGQGVN